MGYLHIESLYKCEDMLNFKEVYALEKIHGTSAHVGLKENGTLYFFSGGEKHEAFKAIFDEAALKEAFAKVVAGFPSAAITVFGEAYGGKCQGMGKTYGTVLRFIAFDVRIHDRWLNVPKAAQFVKDLGLEFVAYEKTKCEVSELDRLRDAPSIQAQRNGCSDDKNREGIVVRPLEEYTRNDGSRVIAKYKNEAFHERVHEPHLLQRLQKDIEVLTQAKAICDEWCTEMRLSHVLGKHPKWKIQDTGGLIKLMAEDIEREGAGEIVLSKEAKSLIARQTALMFKRRITQIKET